MESVGSKTIEGLYDTARHNPHNLLRFWAMDLPAPIRIAGWETRSLYVNDMRRDNGEVPAGPDNAFDRMDAAMAHFHPEAAASTLIMWPEGRNANQPHVVGGGWATDRVTFYVARGLNQGRWCKFLCAHVY